MGIKDKLKARLILWEIKGIIEGKFIRTKLLKIWLTKYFKTKDGEKVMEWLKGKKTYIIMALGVIANGLFAMGYITEEHIKIIDSILAFLGLGTIRAGVSKGNQ